MDLLAELRARRVLAIVRGRDPEASLHSMTVLADEGLSLMEVSLSGAEALGVLERAGPALGRDAVIGAGTILTADDAARAADAGAAFLVSPALGEGVEKGMSLGLPVLAGALTPTEITAAHRMGAPAVKVFPASLGGADYLRALRDPFPHIPLVAVGGVAIDDVPGFLAAGAVAVGLGSPLLGDAPHGGAESGLRLRARRILDVMAASG